MHLNGTGATSQELRFFTGTLPREFNNNSAHAHFVCGNFEKIWLTSDLKIARNKTMVPILFCMINEQPLLHLFTFSYTGLPLTNRQNDHTGAVPPAQGIYHHGQPVHT